MKKSVYIIVLILFSISLTSAFGFPNITDEFNFPGEPITVINFVNASNFSNATNYINSNIGAIGDFNATQFENNAGTLSIIWSWLTGELDDIYLNLSGTNANQNINMSPYNLTTGYIFSEGVNPIFTNNFDIGTEDNQWGSLYIANNIQLHGAIVEEAKVGELAIGIGQIVYIINATGNKPNVFLADNRFHDSSHVYGMAIESAMLGETIHIAVSGEVRGLDTSAFAEGDFLHLTTNGSYQTAVPVNGSAIHIGKVTKSNAGAGIILLRLEPYEHHSYGTTDLNYSIGGFAIDFLDYNRNLIGKMDMLQSLFNWTGNATIGDGDDLLQVNGEQLINGTNAGLTIFDQFTQNAFFRIGRTTGENLKITSQDNDAIFLYTQDSDEQAEHEVRFDMEGGQNMSLAVYDWRFEGVEYMRLLKSVFELNTLSDLDQILIGEKSEVRNAIAEGLFIYRNYTNVDRREGVIGMENDGDMMVSIEMIENNSGDIGEEILFRVQNSDKMKLNGSGLWVQDNITVDNYLGNNLNITGNATIGDTLFGNKLNFSEGNLTWNGSKMQIGSNPTTAKLSVGDDDASDFLSNPSGVMITSSEGYVSLNGRGGAYGSWIDAANGIVYEFLRGRGSLANPKRVFSNSNILKFDMFASNDDLGNVAQVGSLAMSMDGDSPFAGKWVFDALIAAGGGNRFVVGSNRTEINQNKNDADTIINSQLGEELIVNASRNQTIIRLLNVTTNATIGDGDDLLQVNGDLNVTGDSWFGSALSKVKMFIFGNVTIEGNLNQTQGNATINMIYGEMWMNNDTGQITTIIAVQNNWYNLTGFNSSSGFNIGQTLNGFSFDESGESLVALVSGKYKSDFSVSVGNAGNNEEYQFAIAINNVIQNNTKLHRKLGAGGDVGDTGISGFIDLNVNDKINIMVSDKDGTADIQTHSANLNMFRIGD